MKIGVIGLGSIAQKAYLPVITAKEELDLFFLTRNQEKLESLAKKYRISNKSSNLDDLIDFGVEAAFVHTATTAHVPIIERLLNHGVHVYVDKPISYSLAESKRMVELAKENNLKLMVGFNRRFVPMYQQLKREFTAETILLEKNRLNNPQNFKIAIYDDFIHVIDTIRFLAEGQLADLMIDAILDGELLKQLVIKLKGERLTAIGIMNRDSGVNQEILQVIGKKRKAIIKDLVERVDYQGGEERISRSASWHPTLYNRGFVNIVDEFIKVVQEDIAIDQLLDDALVTHKLCEEIIEKIEEEISKE
ncbi:virulence factor [Orenia metallireducens]|jgi:virulence factor|uniref:Gfo/Idh/MocA family protein n=1 Tax=Orenia metallireducens TaxID=1413210 RepID=UPI000D052B1C|nr:Gfo/Idh/MocA family oxidoreductase [Orenia metallireducens]PRX34833.1 virulence factor [Orenia metallireducens]